MNYWKSVASVLTGTMVAQVIPVLGSLVITRLYSPASFGGFSAWLSLSLLLAVLLTCRFEMAVAIEADGKPRRIAVFGTMMAIPILSSFVLLAMITIKFLMPQLLEGYPTELLFILLPMAMLIAVSNIWQQWAAAEGEYRKLNYMRVTQAALVTVLQILAGLFSNSVFLLAITQLIGVLLSVFFNLYIMPLRGLEKITKAEKIIAFWHRHKQLPKFSLPADFINTAAAQLPVLLVASRFGADIAGLLAMTLKVLGAPIGLLGKSVLDVFRRYAASSYRLRGECRQEYVKTFKVLAVGSFGFCLVMAFASEPIFVFAFGEEWAGAGIITIWLLPMFALRFMASPLSYMVYIAEKQHLDLLWQITLLAMTVVSLGISPDYSLALQSYSIGYGVLYLVYLVMSYRFSLGVKI